MKRKLDSSTSLHRRKKAENGQCSPTPEDNGSGPVSSPLNTSNASTSRGSTPKLSGRYKQYFDYSTVDKMKFGTCKICTEKNGPVMIKMQNSNTSGLLWHMKNKHKDIYSGLKPQATIMLDPCQISLEDVYGGLKQEKKDTENTILQIHSIEGPVEMSDDKPAKRKTKREKKNIDVALEQPVPIISTPSETDQFHLIGMMIAAKLRELNEQGDVEQMRLAERLIHDAIFKAQFSQLNMHSHIVVPEFNDL